MMERLTKRDGILVHTVYLGDCGTANILDRLAEYEDTGLQPYHISDVFKDYHKLVDENTELKRLLKSSIEHIKMLSDNMHITLGVLSSYFCLTTAYLQFLHIFFISVIFSCSQ